MVKKFILIPLCTVVALLTLLFVAIQFDYIVEFNHPEFEYIGTHANYKDRPFTGISYEMYSFTRPYKILFFRGGKQVWTEHRWYHNRVKWIEIEYKNGKRHGQYRMWYPNGRVKYLKNYYMGKPHGEFWGWHANGQVSDYHVFTHGQQKVYKSFISDGKPFYNYVVRDEERVGLQGGGFCKTRKVKRL